MQSILKYFLVYTSGIQFKQSILQVTNAFFEPEGFLMKSICHLLSGTDAVREHLTVLSNSNVGLIL